jgi:NitT/TauT family transport system substrate-binding protein
MEKIRMTRITRRAALGGSAAATTLLAAPALRAQSLPELRSIRATAKSWLWIVEDYANALGAFEKAGVKVIGNASGRGVNVDALLSNAAEILLGAPTVTMRVQVRRQPIKMICGMVNKYASHVVVKADILARLGVTEASPVLDKARALKGLRLGTTGPGAAPDFLLRNLLVRAGFKPDSDAQLVAVQGGGPAMLAALERGVIDGFCLSSPTSDVAVARGGAAFLFNMSRNPPPEFADYLYIAATVTDRLAAERGPQLVAYCRGIAAAQRAIRDDPAAFQAWSRGFFGDMDPQIFERSFASDGAIFLADPRITEAHFARNLEVLGQELALLNQDPPPAGFGYAQAVDPRFAAEAMRAS